MNQLNSLLDQIARRIPTPDDAYDRTIRRVGRRLLGRRLLAAAVAVAIAAVPVILLLRSGEGQRTAVSETPLDPWVGLDAGLQFIPAPPRVPAGAATVWTGTELIVWGGAGDKGSGVFADGFTYDPQASVWAPLPDSPLSGRQLAGATWTGSEVLIWGGLDAELRPLNDGAAFNPSSNQWRTLPQAPITGRRPIATVWTGTEMVVWGSGSPHEAPDATGAAYNPVSDVWRLLPEAPISLSDGVAVWTGHELIVMGPADRSANTLPPSSAYFAQAIAYRSDMDTWRTLPSPELTPWVALAWDGSRVLSVDYMGEASAFDPKTDEWAKVSRPPLDGGEFIPRLAYSSGDAVLVLYGGVAVFSGGAWRDLTDRVDVSSDSFSYSYTPVAAGRAVILIPSDTSSSATEVPVWVADADSE